MPKNAPGKIDENRCWADSGSLNERRAERRLRLERLVRELAYNYALERTGYAGRSTRRYMPENDVGGTMKRYAFPCLVVFFSTASDAVTLLTPGYEVVIESHCEEGEVSCDNITYHGKSRKSGNSIDLAGKKRMAMCADGVTPCHMLGYEFKSGDVTYFITEDGLLTVYKGNRVILEEKGEWKD